MEEALAELSHKVDCLAWLYAELMFNARLAAVKRALSEPGAMERLAQKMAVT